MFDIIKLNQEYIKNIWYIKQRSWYNEKLEKFTSLNNITVLTWLIRSWKSSILLKYLENKNNIFYFSKEIDPENKIKNNEDLNKLFNEFKDNFFEVEYIVIDEIQDVKNWEIFIRYVYALKKHKIIITWSNSKLLSSELSTFLAWRYYEISVYPLSFNEFLDFKVEKYSSDIFKEYLIYWWLPEITFLDDLWVKQNYLKVVKDSIILKDIVYRYNIRDYSIFESLMKFISDNIANLTTGRNINWFLQNIWIKIALSTMLDYISFSIRSFIIDKVNRYDLKWKKVLEINNKYYLGDLWLRSAILWDFTTKNIWALLENFIYNELKKAWYEIFIWNYADLEIDFVAKKDWIIKYFQVSYLLSDNNTFEREMKSLLKIKDSYKKFIITLDEYKLWNYEWIEVIWIENFLNNI